jgi:hypothetical protein
LVSTNPYPKNGLSSDAIIVAFQRSPLPDKLMGDKPEAEKATPNGNDIIDISMMKEKYFPL